MVSLSNQAVSAVSSWTLLYWFLASLTYCAIVRLAKL